MTQPSLTTQPPSTSGSVDRGWLRVALVANLIAQMGIIVTGGLVRLTGSGLGCPTWPQCTPGSFTPVQGQAQGWHVFVEFGNRLMTFVLAFIAIALIVAARRWAKDRPNFLALCAVPLLGILAQAVIGGISVLTSLDPKTVSPHFLVSIALVAFSAWLLWRYDHGDGAVVPLVDSTTTAIAGLAGVLFAVLTVLGTAVTGSGPHSGDANEPVRFGFDPLVTSRIHSGSVWLFVATVITLVVLGRRLSSAQTEPFRRWWTLVLIGSLVQGGIGYLQYFNGLPIALVAAHMAMSALLTMAVTFGVLSTRERV